MVELSKKMLKGSIYNSVKNLKGNREWSTVSISDDLSPEENNKLRDFKVYNELIDHVPSYKYLGITLDSCLTFSKHIANLIKVLNHKVYLLNKVRPNLNRKASITIYKSMILPHIDYGDLFYSASNQNLLDKIQRVQNRCLKICLNTNPPPNIGQAHSMTIKLITWAIAANHTC